MAIIDKQNDLFRLKENDLVLKIALQNVIMESRRVDSSIYDEAFIINGTPQRGINWIGELGNIKGILVKSMEKNPFKDGYKDSARNFYDYHFQKIGSLSGLALENNRFLAEQKDAVEKYPIFLLKESDSKNWIVEGIFDVVKIYEDSAAPYCLLKKRLPVFASSIY